MSVIAIASMKHIVPLGDTSYFIIFMFFFALQSVPMLAWELSLSLFIRGVMIVVAMQM